MDKDARRLRNDAFHVKMTLSSDDKNYPILERKIPNKLNVSKDDFEGGEREEFEESLRLDFCCYVDPLNNCNSLAPGRSSNQKCIRNLGKYSTLKN